LNVKFNARWNEIALLDFDVRKRRTTDNSDVNTILNIDALQRESVNFEVYSRTNRKPIHTIPTDWPIKQLTDKRLRSIDLCDMRVT